MMSVVVALGLLGAVLWQAGSLPGLASLPGYSDLLAFIQARTQVQPAAASAPAPAPATAAAPEQPAQDNNPPAEPTLPAAAAPDPVQSSAPTPAPTPAPAAEPPVTKPSPLGPRMDRDAAPRQTPIDAPPPVQGAVRFPKGRPQQPQDLWVTTNPPGAKAVLDDNLGESCRTPCMLHGPSGVHHLTISDAGYLNEYREIHVGDTAQDVPLISLREASGTLMVTTVPPGASVRINGQLVRQVTPAAINLRPGTYSVTVEKGGRSQTERIEIQQSPVYVQIPLGQ
jgi:hypothetical protein